MTASSIYPVALLTVGYVATTAIAVVAWRRRQRRDRARIGDTYRHAERERIARDLHDTLLQGMQGLVLRLQIWERDVGIPEDRRSEIAAATDRVRSLLIEGRDRIAMLRRVEFGQADLLEALDAVARVEAQESTADFRVTISGKEIPMRSDGFGEVVDITKEAILNAFRHARATRIEVIIEYHRSALQINVKDDGCGFDFPDRKTPRSSRHFGLLGMKERAKELSGQLMFGPNGSRGTQVKLCVPADALYAKARRTTHGWLFRAGREVRPEDV
jgi:signal transduction histidine kinase